MHTLPSNKHKPIVVVGEGGSNISAINQLTDDVVVVVVAQTEVNYAQTTTSIFDLSKIMYQKSKLQFCV